MGLIGSRCICVANGDMNVFSGASMVRQMQSVTEHTLQDDSEETMSSMYFNTFTHVIDFNLFCQFLIAWYLKMKTDLKYF